MKLKVICRRICGILILPLLYARYSIFIYLPLLLLFDNISVAAILLFWFLHAIFFGFIMGNFELMKYWSRLFVRIFKVEYKVEDKWISDMVHSGANWRHPILKVRNKKIKMTIGYSVYNEEDILRRKAIISWLLY